VPNAANTGHRLSWTGVSVVTCEPPDAGLTGVAELAGPTEPAAAEVLLSAEFVPTDGVADAAPCSCR
jgi:hypothetical protein